MIAKPNHPIDIYVGSRIRAARAGLGLSQTQLANGLNLTFQQVQKYERGSNRVSASKLYEIAGILGEPIGYFFDGLAENTAPREAHDQIARESSLLTQTGMLKIAKAYAKMTPRQRYAVIEIASATVAGR